VDKVEADHLGRLLFLKVASNCIPHVNMKFLKAVSLCKTSALAINPPSGASSTTKKISFMAALLSGRYSKVLSSKQGE
jgi:hypothetical protein